MTGRALHLNRFEGKFEKGAMPQPNPKTGRREDFIWSDEAEPHMHRRKQLMAKYGKEINKLMKPEPLTKYYCVAFLSIVLGLSVATLEWSWPAYLAGLYVSSIFTHSLFLAVHEVTHHSAFRSQFANDLLSMLVNCGIGVPYSMMFKLYHGEHHKYQGWDGIDTDIPSDLELRLLQSFPGKLFFASCQIPFYAFRPCLVRAQKLSWKHALNWAFVLTFDYIWFSLWGWKAIAFLIASTFLAGSWNPVAGHFISEHYVFDSKGKQETYSYYGPWNAISFNVGYHNEHHDFPSVPWTALPKLRALAPEFYENLETTDSWFMASVRFLFDDNVGVWARVKREKGAGQRTGRLMPTTSDSKSVDFKKISDEGGCLPEL
mmetsp:Transcript_20419/g.63472  ORF Transcript_20419/g.63472 Transcript_20419/m.63472 type:complete len:374 (-) Transcript_20419:331-1452(-)